MKNLLPYFFFSLLISLFSIVQSEAQNSNSKNAGADEVLLKDQHYGEDELQTMDIYLPADRSRDVTKVFIFIHGGGWVTGDKKNLPIERLKTLSPESAVFNLNYRLVNGDENRFPAAVEDIEKAVAFIEKNLEKYQLSDKICLGGVSAGAHLAALYSMSANRSPRTKGCVVISGAFDLSLMYENGSPEARAFLEGFLGGSAAEFPVKYGEASPASYVSGDSPEFLILHGEDDKLTPVEQARVLMSALDEQKVNYKQFIYSGGHGIPPEHMTEAVGHIRAFLDSL